jgi:glycosyltransferase involved in cell wall biosynthesis
MNLRREDSVALSILVPVYNEEGSVRLLVERMMPVLEGLGMTWEVVFVDDGSTDATFARLAEVHAREPRVRVVRLRRNFGQTAALAAGFARVKGRRIVTLDGDLQNDPADIPLLLARMEEGYDIVSGWRRNRQESFWRRTLPSRTANWLIARVSGVSLHDFGCTLRAYDRTVVDGLPLYSEMHRFLPALASLTGARSTEVVVSHHARHAGRSKYGLSRVFRVFVDLLTLQMILRFSTRPREWFGHLAMPFGLLGVLVGLWATYWYVREPYPIPVIVVPGATFLLFYLWFSLLSFGWFAELLAGIGCRERRPGTRVYGEEG